MGGGGRPRVQKPRLGKLNSMPLPGSFFKTSDRKTLPFIDSILGMALSFKTEELINNNTLIKMHFF